MYRSDPQPPVLLSVVSGRQLTGSSRHTLTLQRGALWQPSQNVGKIETIVGELKFLLVSAVPPAIYRMLDITECPVNYTLRMINHLQFPGLFGMKSYFTHA